MISFSVAVQNRPELRYLKPERLRAELEVRVLARVATHGERVAVQRASARGVSRCRPRELGSVTTRKARRVMRNAHVRKRRRRREAKRYYSE